MSIIETFFNTTAVLTRKTTATPTSSDSTTTVSSSISGVLRPVTDVAKLFIENNIGKEFDYVMGTATTAHVGDDLYIGGSKYGVIGVTTFEDLEDDVETYTNLRVVRK